MTLRRWAPAAFFLAAAVLFLLANRGAYRGYFQDDELDNLSWTPHVPARDFAAALVSPRYLSRNFRPVGHFYFRLMSRRFGLDFPKYLVPIHALHLLNLWMVWLLARRLGVGRFGAGAGALFFGFHMAAFDVYWKPMYVFDVLCAAFSLACVLLYIERRWVLSFAAFWLAYKSKELAVMLPAVLACYELWLGKRRWKPLVPFFAVSLSFGLQALLLNPNRGNEYALRFDPAALWRTSSFYASRVLLFPFAGFALLAAPLATRDRRVWFGLAVLLLLLAPLLLLPGRLFAPYCYLPLAGLALVLAAFAESRWRPAVVVFLALWIPYNEVLLRLNRRQALALADENRRYVSALAAFTARHPRVATYLYDGRPRTMAVWGIEGALRQLTGRGDLRVLSMEDPAARQVLEASGFAVLSWNLLESRLDILAREEGQPDASFLAMNVATPLWQLGSGWFPLEGGYRWIAPAATARLYRPPAARQFEVTVNVGPQLIQDLGRTRLTVLLDGAVLGTREFRASGWQTARWDLAERPAGPAQVEFRVEPAFQPSRQDPRLLGVAVVSFGFPPKERR